MTHLHLSPLRRALVLAAITGVAAGAPTAIASPASKTKTPKRSASADLIVRDLEVEFAGETLQIYADVANIGSLRAHKRTAAVVAFSSDETLDEDDEIVDETTVRKLRPTRSFELETEVDIPADEDLPQGDVYLLVCADGYDVLSERKESNNCSSELIASEDDESAGDDTVIEDDESVGVEDESEDEEDFPVSESR